MSSVQQQTVFSCFLSETIQILWRAQWGLELKVFLHSWCGVGVGVGQPKPHIEGYSSAVVLRLMD